jgi:hypothetical protein
MCGAVLLMTCELDTQSHDMNVLRAVRDGAAQVVVYELQAIDLHHD